MDYAALAVRDTPQDLLRELARFGGLNPFGGAVWRVVLAQNVREQCFGVMRHMPNVTADSDVDVETLAPERVEEGCFWVPRYMTEGWILERWFPASTWGTEAEWGQAMAEDGFTRLKGPYPAHGDYFMVGDGPFAARPGISYWKAQIAQYVRAQQNSPLDPALHLREMLYVERVKQEMREEAFGLEVQAMHRAVTEPLLATVSTRAQRVRDGLQMEIGAGGQLAAG